MATANSCYSSVHKFPLRRIEPFLKKCLKKLEVQLVDMNQHKQNIAHLLESSADVSAVRQEYNAAVLTVEQLVVAVQQFEQIRQQVDIVDLPAVDYQLAAAFNGLVVILFQFLQMKGHSVEHEEADSGKHRQQQQQLEPVVMEPVTVEPVVVEPVTVEPVVVEPVAVSVDASTTAEQFSTDTATSSPPGVTTPTPATPSTPSFEEDECWKACHQLELKLLELNDILQSFLKLIDHNTIVLPTLTESVSSPTENKPHSSFNFSNVNLKLLMMPVAGAVLGGVIAGPVGLVAGLKVGKIAAVSGGLIGLTGGTLLKKRKENESHDQAEQHAVDVENDNETNELKETNPLMNVM